MLKATVLDRGLSADAQPVERKINGIGNGPIAAFLNALHALDITVSVMDYAEHAMGTGTDAMAASYVECEIGEESAAQVIWGVGIDSSITTSSMKAIISAINRTMR